MAKRWMSSATGSVVAHAVAAGFLFLPTGIATGPTPPAAAVLTFEPVEAPPTLQPPESFVPNPFVAAKAPAPRPYVASLTNPPAARVAEENRGWMKPSAASLATTARPDVSALPPVPAARSTAERFAPFSAPTRSLLDDPVAEDKPPLDLKAVGGGGFEADRIGFKAHVARDGTMTFTDKANLRVRAKLPCASCMARGLGRWAKDPYGYQTTHAGDPLAGTSLHTTNLERGIADEPAGNDDPEDNAVIVVGIAGGFDLGDWALRAMGDDPYAAEKLRLFEATYEKRAGMRTAETTRRLRRSLRRLPRFLQAIWNERRVPVAQRRRTLFALWDECAEEGSKERLAVAAAVRATIVAFVRRELPVDSVHAFGKEELATLNQTRSSKQRFAPYAARQ